MPDTESANGESDSFDRWRQLWSDVVCNAEDTRHVADDLLSEFLKGFKWKMGRRRSSCIDAVSEAHLNLLTKITLTITHSGYAVFVKNRNVLERVSSLEQSLHDCGALSDSLNTLSCYFPNYACRECRPRERDTLGYFIWKAKGIKPRRSKVYLHECCDSSAPGNSKEI